MNDTAAMLRSKALGGGDGEGVKDGAVGGTVEGAEGGDEVVLELLLRDPRTPPSTAAKIIASVRTIPAITYRFLLHHGREAT